MRIVTVILGLLVLCGCATVETTPIEKLDEHSGDTLIIVRQPLNFVRISPEVQTLRDYLTLVAVETDHIGQYSSYLLAYRWSTVENSLAPLPDKEVGALQIDGGARQWSLTPLAEVPESLRTRRDLYAPYPLAFGVSAYRVGLPELLAMADSAKLEVHVAKDERMQPPPQPLQLLDDGRAALREFARRDDAK